MAKHNKISKGTSKDGHKIEKSKKGSIVKAKRKHPKVNSKKKIQLKKKKVIADKENNKQGENEKKKHDKVKVDRKRTHEPDQKKSDKRGKKQSEIVTNLMVIYETIRRKNVSKDERSKLIDQVLEIASDQESQVIYKHDTVRVLEMCMKFGNEKQKNLLFDLFKENLVELVTSTYAKFLVEKFIEYGSKDQKRKIIESFYGKVKKLIKHKGAGSIVDEIYDKYANASQRAALVEEFYGPEFTVFKVASGRSLDDILSNEPEKKKTVMSFMKDSFVTLCQKDIIVHSIVHRALFDFFKYASLPQAVEVVDVLKEGVIHILHTKDGAKVAMQCLWHSTTKDRKLILKSFKTHVAKICKEEYGHLVMLALFDVVDDTVLVKKALFPEMISELESLILDPYGRKVLLYLLKPRDKSYFSPDIVKLLEQGDSNTHSKKEMSVRQSELRSGIISDLLVAMVNNIKDILPNKRAAVVLLAALEVSFDLPESRQVLEAIIELLKTPFEADEQEGHPVADACGHWVVKNLIKQDKLRIDEGVKVLFSKLLCDAIPRGYFTEWAASGRGAFVIVSLLETGIESVVKRVKKDLKTWTRPNSEEHAKGLEVLEEALADS